MNKSELKETLADAINQGSLKEIIETLITWVRCDSATSSNQVCDSNWATNLSQFIRNKI